MVLSSPPMVSGDLSPLRSSPAVCGGDPSFFRHTRGFGSKYPYPLPSYPQFVAGIHPKGTQDGCPIKVVILEKRKR